MGTSEKSCKNGCHPKVSCIYLLATSDYAKRNQPKLIGIIISVRLEILIPNKSFLTL